MNELASTSCSVSGPSSTTRASWHLSGTCALLMVMLGLAVTRSLRLCPAAHQQQWWHVEAREPVSGGLRAADLRKLAVRGVMLHCACHFTSRNTCWLQSTATGVLRLQYRSVLRL
jgi:hypothetical protein